MQKELREMYPIDRLGTVGRHIVAFGLARSGNHCIYHWLVRNLIKNGAKSVWVFNNIHHGPRWHHDIYHKSCGVYKSSYQNQDKYHKIGISEAEKDIKIEANKSVLLTGFENDPHIKSFEGNNYFNCRLYKNNPSITTIHILRDPFNLLASTLSHFRFGNSLVPARPIELWIEHAKQALKRVAYLTEPIVTILYNRWVRDIEYRKFIVSKLNMNAYVDSIDYVAEHGGGSSFDGFDFQGKGNQMRTTERWEDFKDNDWYANQIRRKEVIELSSELFPTITKEVCDFYRIS